MTELLERRPAQLSGGQRQRVAMGRAIVRQPQAFLLDEPLSNLDAKLRVGMRASLAQLHQRLGVTTVYVTHDQTEAMTLGQRVAVMRDGRILQCDRPQVLYARPDNLFIAAFIGSPAMNLVEATLRGRRRALRAVPRAARDARLGAERVVLGIRPESFEDAAFAPGLPDDRGAGRGGRGARLGRPCLLPRRRAADDRRGAGIGFGRRFAGRRPRALHRPGRRPHSRPRRRARSSSRSIRARFHFFDPETGARLETAAAPELVGAR